MLVKSNLRIGAAIAAIVVAKAFFADGKAVAAIITGVTATASSEQPNFGGRLAISAVDGSGISGSGDLATDGAFVHDSNPNDMWQTYSDPTVGANPGDALNQTLTIDLNALYSLDGMRIWNFNQAGGADTAIAAYSLETSPDGTAWTTQLSNQALDQAPGTNGYVGVYSAVNWTDVEFVRFTILDTYRPNDDIAGLSEVMFTGVPFSPPVPEPSTVVLLAAAVPFLFRRLRRIRSSN